MASKALEDLLKQDPFFEELLNDHDASVMTLGRLNYVRDILLDLQPSVDKVDEMITMHNSAVSLLSQIANALRSDVDNWKAGMKATAKAKEEERKAKEREQARLEKKRKAEELKQKKKRDKELEKQQKDAQAAASAEDTTQVPDGPEQDQDKRRRRTRTNVLELDQDTDLPIIFNARRFGPEYEVGVFDELANFATAIWNHSTVSKICRLKKKGSIKHVLKMTPPRLLDSQQVASLAKSILDAVTDNATKFDELLNSSAAAAGRDRTTKQLDLAGTSPYLGFDRLIQEASENALTEGSTGSSAILLDREDLMARKLGFF